MKPEIKAVFLCRLAAVGVFGFVPLAVVGQQLLAPPTPVPPEQAQAAATVRQTSLVHDAFGGQIFGFDVDHNGNEGLLSEAMPMGGGTYLIATETFDQTTGGITAVVEMETGTADNFVTLGVFGSHIGLRERQHVEAGFVVQRIYNILNPLSGHRFTGAWTPPVNDKTQHFEDVEEIKTSPVLSGWR